MMHGVIAALLAALVATAACGCVPDLPGQGQEIAAARYTVKYRTQPDKVAVGDFFAVEFALCAESGAALPDEVRIDARMPEHRHGMNYKAIVKSVGPGRYRGEGLMLHMTGLWEFVFELRAGGRTERLTHRRAIE
jgi:hypothetical protein